MSFSCVEERSGTVRPVWVGAVVHGKSLRSTCVFSCSGVLCSALRLEVRGESCSLDCSW